MTANNLSNNSSESLQAIGYVVNGSLKANLFVRLTVPAQSVQEAVSWCSRAATGFSTGWWWTCA